MTDGTDAAPGDVNRAREFGRHLHRIRTEVLEQSLREFASTVGLSPSYIGKMENAEAGVPKRSTIQSMAARLGMKPDGFLLKAGYLPDFQRTPDDEYLLILFGTLTPEQKEAARVLIQAVKDDNLVKSARLRP